MVKSVFVGMNLESKEYENLGRVGANHFIVAGQDLNDEKWWIIKRTGVKLTVSVTAFDHGGCPLEPLAKKILQERIQKVLKWEPKEIWFDHFRFDGHWESAEIDPITKEYNHRGIHTPCKWCKDKDRAREVVKLAIFARSLIPNPVLLGYFAVPFEVNEQTKIASELGQDHRLVGKIFDMAAPMLYHRLIKKPASYISEYAVYLHSLTLKPVLPIIQIKDMSDNLPDELSGEEVHQAFDEAKKLPSSGVCIFDWEHALEKGRVDLIRQLFSSS